MLLAQQRDPISLVIRTNIGTVLNFAHRFEDAPAACRKALELDPGFAAAHICLGNNYDHLGKYAEAITEYALD